MMVAWWLVAAAAAAVPANVFPVPAPYDVHQQYAEHLAASGATGPRLACDALWTGEAMLCFKVEEKGRRRWVTEKDLAAWKVDYPTLRAAVTERAIAALATQPKKTAVDGMTAHYWVAAEGDGWSVAGALHPRLLAEKLGTVPIAVAIPAEGVLIAWVPGDKDLDRVLAVGVRDMYESQDGPVTPVIHSWTGERWVPYGEAAMKEAP